MNHRFENYDYLTHYNYGCLENCVEEFKELRNRFYNNEITLADFHKQSKDLMAELSQIYTRTTNDHLAAQERDRENEAPDYEPDDYCELDDYDE